jgi:hypothetical protein
MRRRGTTVAAVLGAAVLSLAAGCGIGSGSTTELVVYNAQHEDLVSAMLAGLREGEWDQRHPPQRQRLRAGQPDRPEGSGLCRRLPHRELAGDDAGVRQGSVRAADEDTMAQVPAAFVAPKKD